MEIRLIRLRIYWSILVGGFVLRKKKFTENKKYLYSQIYLFLLLTVKIKF